jgi:short-subunit dehydrogenase
MTKIILITGASSGLGKATAEYLASKNYKVFGTSRNPKNYPKNNAFDLLPFDLNQPRTSKALVEKVMKKNRRIDVLINNAGVGITGAIEETDIAAMESNFKTNFFGPLALTQQILPIMRSQKSGLVINITSIGGYMGLPFRGIYSSSKAALATTTEALRMEVKRFGIDVITLAPGDYATDIAARRHYSPIKEDSPYHDIYKFFLDTIDQHVDSGSNPQDLAKMVHKIIKTKKRKVHYTSGSFLQKISITLKKILPDTIYEKLIMNHYKL